MFCWRAYDGPLIVVFGSALPHQPSPHQKKTTSELDPLWQNFLDPCNTQQNIGPDLDPNCLTFWWYSWNYSSKNLILLNKNCRQWKFIKKIPSMQSVSTELLQESKGHDGAKPSMCAYLQDGKIFTTGFSRMSARQYALWDEVRIRTQYNGKDNSGYEYNGRKISYSATID